MRTRSASLALVGLALAGCAATSAVEPGAPPAGACDREAGQRFVGRTASAALATEMLRATGATRLRWVPPRTAVTMIFEAGRLTVGYDDAMRVTSVSCS